MVVGKGPPYLRVRAFPVCGKPRGREMRREACGQRALGLTLSSWDRVLQTKAHQYQITGCCLSPDYRLLATVCLGGCLKVKAKSCGPER